MLVVVADANCIVIVDSKDAAGRRRRHRAGMLRRRPRGQQEARAKRGDTGKSYSCLQLPTKCSHAVTSLL